MVVLSFLAVIVAISSSRLTRADHESPLTARIKNVVVLVQENRSFDNIAGGFTYSHDIDGLVGKQFCNPVNATDPSLGTVCASPTLPDVTPDDPNHGISGVNMELFGTFHPTSSSVQTMQGFLFEQQLTFKTSNLTRAAEAIQYYNENDVPVMKSLAENFVLFDKWFCAVPGPTNPNRAYITAGTSAGHGRNDISFEINALNVRSIFQQLSENDVSWINYSNASFAPDALFYNWTVTSGAATTNIKPLTQFFTDAQAGKLPQFTYINPECCSVQSFHPPSSTTDGQVFVKTIYEALRASPQWEQTLFILTFDEHGGFADHVPPPENVPAGDSITYTETALDGKPVTFDFTRLGVRVPTYLISPWVAKGFIEHEGKNSGGVYTHTSILAFLANLWGLDTLTPRVGFSSTFEHLILEKKRETIKKLPTPFQF
jgi:phospholipase C